ncbi:hypothetical protein GCM10020000_02030 [Streptomyces olivoverticillatus]
MAVQGLARRPLPGGLPPQRLWLEEYARHFTTVENNNAFYRLPTPETFAGWHDRTPEGFVMAVKASRYLTHIKRLHDPEEPVHRLMRHAAGLGVRLGPVLLQLPPTLRADPAALESALSFFPARTRVAVEPRHDSWWTQEVRAVLERHGAALCWADHGSRPVTPLWRTADWGGTCASTPAGRGPGRATGGRRSTAGPGGSPTAGPRAPTSTPTSTTTRAAPPSTTPSSSPAPRHVWAGR